MLAVVVLKHPCLVLLLLVQAGLDPFQTGIRHNMGRPVHDKLSVEVLGMI